jgi:hypothetical protein
MARPVREGSCVDSAPHGRLPAPARPHPHPASYGGRGARVQGGKRPCHRASPDLGHACRGIFPELHAGVLGAWKLLSSADADVVDRRRLLSQRRRKGGNTSPAQAAQRTERLVTGQDAHGNDFLNSASLFVRGDRATVATAIASSFSVTMRAWKFDSGTNATAISSPLSWSYCRTSRILTSFLLFLL